MNINDLEDEISLEIFPQEYIHSIAFKFNKQPADIVWFIKFLKRTYIENISLINSERIEWMNLGFSILIINDIQKLEITKEQQELIKELYFSQHPEESTPS